MAKTETETRDMDNEAKITLGLLNVVHDNSTASQRFMASDLGIALGLANMYLKRCVKKGLIKVRQVPANRYAYYLTPMGFAEKSRLTAEFLSQSLNLFRHARAEGRELFSHCQNRGWQRVALYGAGDLAEILTLSVRDFTVELAAVISNEAGLTQFADLPVLQEVPGTGEVDAVIICDIVDSQGAYDAAAEHFPAERILVPEFLDVTRDSGTKGGDRQ